MSVKQISVANGSNHLLQESLSGSENLVRLVHRSVWEAAW